MIKREVNSALLNALKMMPVVALLGPRQVGKTTLALSIGEQINKKATYLDLELDSDMNKLSDAENYLKRYENELLIIDEVQKKPELFSLLRSLVDIRKRKGEKSAHFLLLGSASKDLLQQSSETLAGRIRYLELTPFTVNELFEDNSTDFNLNKIWLRGGFPDSYLAENDNESWNWRSDFIATYLERDIPFMGPNISANKLKRFWTMLAHYHGNQMILSELGRSMELTHTTIRTYLDLLTDFYMVRQVQPWSGNIKKRLVKTPKIYVRDSGLLHRLLQINNFENLLGHPVLGASWEGFVVENIINKLDDKWKYSYFRTSTQVEIDLVLETPNKETWAIEVKRTSAPKLSKGFHIACDDIKAHKKWVINTTEESYPIEKNTEVIGLIDFLKLLN